MKFVRQIRGVQVKDLITKFFYQNNQLCFQILLHLEGGKTVLFKEFADYSGYKRAMATLHDAREKDTVIKISKKNMKSTAPSSNVA